VFGNIILGILAIIFWPVTLGVGAVILIWALWMTFVRTKDHYTPPRDEETGEELKSFLMGGEWDEEDPPTDEDCINAWMFLLADAKGAGEGEAREETVKRALGILNFTDGNDLTTDLIFHLRQHEGANWLESELIKHKHLLNFPLDNCLKAAKKSTGIPLLTSDWRTKADEELDRVRATITPYSEDEITLLASQFATFMRANGADLIVDIETYEITSFSKALARFEWGGKTVTQQGLAHMGCSFRYSLDEIPSGSDLKDFVWEKIWETKQADYDFEYGFIFSETTARHNGEEIPVVVDIDEAPARYIWTVSEGSMDFDVYEEKREGETTTEITKAIMRAGKLTACFEIEHESAYIQFLEYLNESLDQLTSKAEELLNNIEKAKN
jgi:hypothetical protein